MLEDLHREDPVRNRKFTVEKEKEKENDKENNILASVENKNKHINRNKV